MKHIIILFALILALATPAAAQQHELTIAAGGAVSFNPETNVGTGFTLQGNYAYRLFALPLVSLHAEIPVTGVFNISSRLPQQIQQRDFNALFVTPGLKLKFGPELPATFYVVGGGGWARFRQEDTNIRTTTNVVDFGIGTEFKLIPLLGFRTEVRDFYSGALKFDPTFFTGRQHNIVFTAGLQFRL